MQTTIIKGGESLSSAISLWNTRNFALDIPEHLKNTIGLYEGTTQGAAMAVRGHVQAAFDK